MQLAKPADAYDTVNPNVKLWASVGDDDDTLTVVRQV